VNAGPLPARLRPRGAVGWIVAVAIVYRALAYLAIGPLIAPSDDSTRYVADALEHGERFTDFAAPAGYSLFLAAVHTVWPAAAAVSLLQHVLGLVAGVAMLRLGEEVATRTRTPRRAALVPGAVILLGGDLLFFEQSLMTETLFMALLVPAVLMVLRAESRTGRRALAALGVAGLLLGASIVVRTAGIPAVFAIAAYLVLPGFGAARERLARAGAVLAPAAVVVAVYVLVASGSDGGQSGFGSFDGWNLYGRVAQFADCADFTPDPPADRLCERRPAAERPGIFFYQFRAGSPALALFKTQPSGNDDLRGFALQAIAAQPGDYLRTVAKDGLRFIDPQFGVPRPDSGAGPEFMTYRTRTADYPPRDHIEQLYGYEPSTGPFFQEYESWLQVSRVPGIVWLAAAILALAGLLLGTSAQRRLLALLGALVASFTLVPILTVTYEYRFGVPAQGFGLLAAIVGLAAVRTRLTRSQVGSAAVSTRELTSP
jgi:hypothetical protein